MAALFPNPDHLLRPGQYAKVRVIDTKTGVLVVPDRAISELQGSRQVTVVGPDNKADARTIVVGTHVGALWTVEKGLNEGERVVVAGLQKVRPGIVVDPHPATAVAESGSSGGAGSSGAAGVGAAGASGSPGASGAPGASQGSR